MTRAAPLIRGRVPCGGGGGAVRLQRGEAAAHRAAQSQKSHKGQTWCPCRVPMRSTLDRLGATLGCVGHRQSKPRSVQGPRRAPTRMTVPYGWGRGACKLGPQPSSCARIHASLTMTAGTLCRDARGLSSEQKERLALRMLAPKRVLAVPHLHSPTRARGRSARTGRPPRSRCSRRMIPVTPANRGGGGETGRRHGVWGAIGGGRAGRAKDVR